MSEIDEIFEKHKEDKKEFYENNSCLSEILEKIEELKSKYEKRKKLLFDIQDKISIVINSVLKSKKTTFGEKYTVRDDKVYKYNSGERVYVNEFIEKEFIDFILENCEDKYEEGIERLFKKVKKFKKALEIEFGRRTYYTRTNEFKGKKRYADSRFYNGNWDLYFLYEIEDDYMEKEDSYYRIFNMVKRRKKKKKKRSITNSTVVASNDYEMKKPSQIIDKKEMKEMEHYSEKMMFLVERALKEVNYELEFLEELDEMINNNFKKIIVASKL